jgi:hypothetical protein
MAIPEPCKHASMARAWMTQEMETEALSAVAYTNVHTDLSPNQLGSCSSRFVAVSDQGGGICGMGKSRWQHSELEPKSKKEHY